MGLQAIPIFRYSFSYSLEFHGKRYQWYHSMRPSLGSTREIATSI